MNNQESRLVSVSARSFILFICSPSFLTACVINVEWNMDKLAILKVDAVAGMILLWLNSTF